MKKKRVLALTALLLVCVFGISACKKNVGTPEDNPQVKEETDEEEQEKYTFGFSGITMENPYFITLESSIRETLEKDGHTLITEDPKQDPDVQVEQIEDMIDQGIDAIFLTPVDWEAITPALEELKEADVKIINVDTQVKEFDYVDEYIGSDHKNAGYLCGKDLVEKLPEGGKVLILECPTMNSINERITGFEEAIADKGFEVVGRSDTKGDLNTALSAAETLLKEHPDVSAIMCGNDPTALGALVAANAAQLQNVYIYGVDGSPEIKKELEKENSLIAATGGQSPIEIGKESAKVALSVLNKEKYARITYEETFLINKDNLEMYGVDGWQ